MVILLGLGAVFLIGMMYNNYLPDGIFHPSYRDSKVFEQEVTQEATWILEGIRAEKKLQEKTKDGADRLIDIQTMKEADGKDGGKLLYRMADLKAWEEETLSIDQVAVVAKKPDGTYQYFHVDDFIDQIEKKKLNFVFDVDVLARWGGRDDLKMSVFDALRIGYTDQKGYTSDYGIQGIADKNGNVKFVSIWTKNMFQERYTPVGYDSLLDFVNQSPEYNGKLSEVISDVDAAVNSSVRDWKSMTSYLQHHEEGKSNLTYLLINTKDRSVQTNRKDFASYQTYQKSLKAIKEKGCCVIFYPDMTEKESDQDIDLSNWMDILQNWEYFLEEGDSSYTIFALSIDTAFPVDDAMAQSAKKYETYVPWTLPVLIVGTLLSILLFIDFVILTMAAGRKLDSDEISLNGFDRIFTEVAAVGTAGVWLFSFVLLVDFFMYNGTTTTLQKVSTVGAVFLCAALTGGLFLLGYLSLVRRIKAKTLWKNSLLCWLLQKSRRFLKKLRLIIDELALQMNVVVKCTLMVVGFLGIQFILSLLVPYSFFFFLLLLIVDLASLYGVLRFIAGRQRILQGLEKISGGQLDHKIATERLYGDHRKMAELINNIGAGLDAAVESSLKNERMKTELITNVSHDIKTPLTSIINYIDLLKREELPGEKVQGYLQVLDAKAQRLKVLTEDVVEASKISTGNISLEMTDLNFVEMILQVIGEFQEKFEERNLQLLTSLPGEPLMIRADGRRMWRVLANVFNNTAKYAMEGTRVYADIKKTECEVSFILKNISAQPLNISAEELTERFIRGDVARSTEGSGLGLSIAQNLTQLQGGSFLVTLDGDLFKVTITFPYFLKEEKKMAEETT